MQKLAEANTSVFHTYGIHIKADYRTLEVVALFLFTEPLLWWYRNFAYG